MEGREEERAGVGREAYFLRILKGGFLCQVALDSLKMPESFQLESAGNKVKEKTYIYSVLRFVPYYVHILLCTNDVFMV